MHKHCIENILEKVLGNKIIRTSGRMYTKNTGSMSIESLVSHQFHAKLLFYTENLSTERKLEPK